MAKEIHKDEALQMIPDKLKLRVHFDKCINVDNLFIYTYESTLTAVEKRYQKGKDLFQSFHLYSDYNQTISFEYKNGVLDGYEHEYYSAQIKHSRPWKDGVGIGLRHDYYRKSNVVTVKTKYMLNSIEVKHSVYFNYMKQIAEKAPRTIERGSVGKLAEG